VKCLLAAVCAGQYMGYAGGAGNLLPGDNSLTMTGVFIENPSGNEKARRLFSSYLQGVPTQVQLKVIPVLSCLPVCCVLIGP